MIDESLLIIDDNESFLISVEKELWAEFETITYIISEKYSNNEIVEIFKQSKPDYLLIDLNLDTHYRSLEIIRALACEKLLRGCEVRVISFGVADTSVIRLDDQAEIPSLDNRYSLSESLDDKILNEFMAISPSVKGPLIRKPITAFSLVNALTGFEIYDAPKEWDGFPLPLRVLDKKGSIAYANLVWRKSNMYLPDPAEFEKWVKHGDVPEVKHYHGSYFDEDSDGFYVHSFYLECNGNPYLGQVVDSQKIVSKQDNFDEVVDEIFEAMEKAGFPRGQCFVFYPLIKRYSVFEDHNSAGLAENQAVDMVVKLERVSKSYSDSARQKCGNSSDEAVTRPLRGELLKRMEDYQSRKQKDKTGTLIYKVRSARDDKATKNKDIVAWSEGLEQKSNQKDYVSSWLEIPIIANAKDLPFYTGEQPYQVIAMLMFNRKRMTSGRSSSLYDSSESIEEDMHVKPINILLKNLVQKFSKALFERSRYRYEERYNHISQSDQAIVVENNADVQKQRLVQYIGEGTKAEYVLLLKRDLSSNEIILDTHWSAQKAEPLSDEIQSLRVPVTSTLKPMHIVQSWIDKRPLCLQSLEASHYIEKIRGRVGLLKSKITPEKHIEMLSWLDWLETYVESALAYPIVVNDECIGLIVLYFSKPWFLTVEKAEYLYEFSQRTKWVLQTAYQEEQQKLWLLTIAHEMLGDLNLSWGALQDLRLGIDPGHRVGDDLTIADLGLTNSLDLAKNWMAYLGNDREQGDKNSFNPDDVIDKTIILYKAFIDSMGARVHKTSAVNFQHHSVVPINEAIFVRVFRILLRNAVKHGRSYLDGIERYEDVVQIEITSAVAEGYYRLTINNPGYLSERELTEIFQESKSYSRRSDGAGIGLIVARQLVNKLGGRIELNNMNDTTVIATLDWPLNQ